MSKVIDLYLDLPTDEEYLVRTLKMYCLGEGNTTYAGYKNSFGNRIAKQIGYTMDELDQIVAEKGEVEFENIIRTAARSALMSMDDFIKHLDGLGVEWGATSTHDHNNMKTAELIKKYPGKFIGFAYINPNDGIMNAVRELEYCIKELNLSAAYLTAFRTGLPADHKKCYPIYAKACELNIPVFIYCSMNLSAGVPMDIGHPRLVDEVARDFPELKIMASVGGWPWVMDMVGVALRHKNVYINMEVHEPASLQIPGKGFESMLYWASDRLQDKFCFASNWNVQGVPLKTLIEQMESLPVDESIKRKWLYENAKNFFNR